MRKKMIIVVCLLTLGCPLCFAKPICPLGGPVTQPRKVSSLDQFGAIAILSDGRVKPVDTYARTLLLQLSGKTSLNKESAVAWLARLLFAPATTFNDKVFIINNPETAFALGVTPDPKRRYSFTQLRTGFAKLAELARLADKIDAKKRSAVEEEVIRVYHNCLLYDRHTRVFYFALPSAEFQIADTDIVKALDLPPQQTLFSFYDLASRADLLRQQTKSLELNRPEDWSFKEKELFRLMNNLYHWSISYRDLPFQIIPAPLAFSEQWLSPMDAISRAFADPQVREEIALVRTMVVSYWNGEEMLFDFAIRSFSNSIINRVAGAMRRNISTIPFELFYNQANLFGWARVLYAMALGIFLFSFLAARQKRLRPVALALIVAGLFYHVVAIALRIIIMGRPPVSNLYETFIFVGMVTVLAGITIELVNRRWVGISVAGVCGFVFLTIAGKFAAEGDTLRMLVAVLNSNFWLGTHVLSITAGYSGVCVAGLVGHLYILQCIRYPKDKIALKSTYHNMIGALGFGLIMSFLGTTLGGIWADQSWGRFWGWDPKENGALLIILWCAIIFHARIGRFIGPLGVAVGSVLGIVVVMWAWFGVNLLSVGLHSYGFTSGVATGLMMYVAGEVLFLTIGVSIARRNNIKLSQS